MEELPIAFAVVFHHVFRNSVNGTVEEINQVGFALHAADFDGHGSLIRCRQQFGRSPIDESGTSVRLGEAMCHETPDGILFPQQQRRAARRRTNREIRKRILLPENRRQHLKRTIGGLRRIDSGCHAVFIKIGTQHAEIAEIFAGSGIVVVRAGEICDKFYSLIRPEPEYYFYWNTRVHGLTLEDTARAPLFPEVWKEVAPRIEGLPLVAHNSPFDEGCLRAVFRTYQMDYPDYEFYCTCRASRRVFGRELPNHQLQTVAARCGYDLKAHHHALADAEACAWIAKTIL